MASNQKLIICLGFLYGKILSMARSAQLRGRNFRSCTMWAKCFQAVLFAERAIQYKWNYSCYFVNEFNQRWIYVVFLFQERHERRNDEDLTEYFKTDRKITITIVPWKGKLTQNLEFDYNGGDFWLPEILRNSVGCLRKRVFAYAFFVNFGWLKHMRHLLLCRKCTRKASCQMCWNRWKTSFKRLSSRFFRQITWLCLKKMPLPSARTLTTCLHYLLKSLGKVKIIMWLFYGCW